MAEYTFAPKDKPIGNLPLPTNQGTGPTILGPAWSGFTRGDMPMFPDRNQITDDGGHVWRQELRDTDRGGYSPATCRNEAYTDHVYYPGQTLASCFGFKLASDFPAFPGWSVLYQVHTPYDATQPYWSPMIALTGDGGKLHVQNNSTEGGVDWTGEYDRGRWHYWIFEVLFGRPGHLTVWHSLDLLPKLTDAPIVDVARNTTIPNHSTKTGDYSKNGMYRSIASEGKTHVMWRDGYAEADTVARARELYVTFCRPAALGTPPAPAPTNRELIVAAKAELEQTTVSGKSWVQGGRKPGHWKNAYQLLDKIVN